MRLPHFGTHWLQMLVFLGLALIVWFVITSEQVTIVQRALEVPLAVTGLAEDQVAIGLPDHVIFIVSGPSVSVERLRPEYFDAFIDLRDASQTFDVPVRFIPPQGIDVLSVTPERVIGIIEALDVRSVPVRVYLSGEASLDGLSLRVEPSEAVVSGQETQVARVEYVSALVDTIEGNGQILVNSLFASDGQGAPVEDVAIQPAEVTVEISRETAWYVRAFAVELIPPGISPLAIEEVTLNQEHVHLAGPLENLEGIEQVEATVTLSSEALEPGRYTVEVVPRLPEGVVALERLSAELEISDPRQE